MIGVLVSNRQRAGQLFLGRVFWGEERGWGNCDADCDPFVSVFTFLIY